MLYMCIEKIIKKSWSVFEKVVSLQPQKTEKSRLKGW